MNCEFIIAFRCVNENYEIEVCASIAKLLLTTSPH